MAKKAKKVVKKPVVEKVEKKKIPLWKWIVVLIPLIVGIMWAISLISLRNQIPLVYEGASPGSVNSLLVLVLLFIVSYGTFVFMRMVKEQ
jgi:hypothetical protein